MWHKILERIEAALKVGTNLDTDRSHGRTVMSAGPVRNSRAYGYRGCSGWYVRIGRKAQIGIPTILLEECYRLMHRHGRFDSRIFRKRFPRQAAYHPCHSHVVGQIFRKAGIARWDDAAQAYIPLELAWAESTDTNEYGGEMTKSMLARFGTPEMRVEQGLLSLRRGGGVLTVSHSVAEVVGAVIYPGQSLTEAQMALLVRECCGLVRLCLTPSRAERLGLEARMEDPETPGPFSCGFSVSAVHGVGTGISVVDRLRTVRTCLAPGAQPEDLRMPGYVFPVAPRQGGVLERPGISEAAMDLMSLAGLKPGAVFSETINPDGSASSMPELVMFAESRGMPILSVDDIISFRLSGDVRPAAEPLENEPAF